MNNDKEKKEQGQEEQAPRRTLLFFTAESLVIPVWGILTIEKAFELDDRLTSIYKVIINRGIEIGSTANPVGERTLTFYDPKKRDEQFNLIIKTLQDNNVQFVTF